MNSRERAEKYLRDHFNGRHDDFDLDKLAAEFDAHAAESRREALEEAIAAIAKEQAPWGFTPTNATYERAIRALKEKTP